MPGPPRRASRLAGLALLIGALGLALALREGWLEIPDRYNPWAELEPAAAPNLLTGMKLRRAQANAPLCLALLRSSGLHVERVPDRVTGPGCALQDAVRLTRGRNSLLRSPVLLSCRAALSFAMWERHVLQPAAIELLGTPVARIDHLGSYACRDVVTGRPVDGAPGRRSRHATADALDVAAFTRVDGGRVIEVRRDWRRTSDAAQPEPEAAFLRKVHRGACGLFDAVLGPDYNAVHADHLHLEVGDWRTCR